MKESIKGFFNNSSESGDSSDRKKSNREKVQNNQEEEPKLYHATDRIYKPGDIIEGFTKGMFDLNRNVVFLHDKPVPHYTIVRREDPTYKYIYEVIPIDASGEPNRSKAAGNRREWGMDLMANKVKVLRRVMDTDRFRTQEYQDKEDYRQYTDLWPLHKDRETSHVDYLGNRYFDYAKDDAETEDKYYKEWQKYKKLTEESNKKDKK